jgi:hypothetical protein
LVPKPAKEDDMPEENPIKIVPGSGGVFDVTCGEHKLRFQCRHHRGSWTAPGHLEIRGADLHNQEFLEYQLLSARESGDELVVAMDEAEIDMADLSNVATRAHGLDVSLVVRHDG